MEKWLPRRRISFFIQHYPPYLGGAETQARILAAALLQRGHAVQIFTTRFSRDLPRVSNGDGPKVRRLPTLAPRGLKLPINFLTGLWAGFYLARDSEVFHGHCLSAFTLGALLGTLCRRRPILIKVGSTGGRGDVTKILNAPVGEYLWRLFLHAQIIIAPTHPVAAELTGQGASSGQVKVVPNILCDKRFVEMRDKPVFRRQLGLPERLTVLFVGRLSSEKGIDRLLQAWPQVIARIDAQLVLVGEGHLRGEIERTIDMQGLTDSVILAGYSPDPDPYYHAADLFAFPSHSESFGNVIVEAMSYGLPVLSTVVGVIKEWPLDAPVIRLDGDGSISWSDQLVRLLRDPELRSELGRRTCAFVSGRYPADEICSCYENIYDRLLDSAKGGS